MFKKFLKNHSFSEFDFRSDFLPGVSDREFWEAFPDDDIISSAEAEINFSWPIIKATDFMEYKISGNRSIMERPHFDRRRHLVLFTLAELKENQGRFLPQIVNGLWTICEGDLLGTFGTYAQPKLFCREHSLCHRALHRSVCRRNRRAAHHCNLRFKRCS